MVNVFRENGISWQRFSGPSGFQATESVVVSQPLALEFEKNNQKVCVLSIERLSYEAEIPIMRLQSGENIIMNYTAD
ncbi:hypothetical protein DSCW_30630 [Desulfosarcina widdelii]|uniref:Uncharacterized protein n=1 Tax=Desulfosarcina widdelii TaxID=947919 RepID=A0A5K7Z1T9_9BACT|nr:hypothetical protein DSCW_30630 [Desulfosarcina widdelii]